MSLSCVVQTLWDLSSYSEGDSAFNCQFENNVCSATLHQHNESVPTPFFTVHVGLLMA